MATYTWYLQGVSPTTLGATDILQFAGAAFDQRNAKVKGNVSSERYAIVVGAKCPWFDKEIIDWQDPDMPDWYEKETQDWEDPESVDWREKQYPKIVRSRRRVACPD